MLANLLFWPKINLSFSGISIVVVRHLAKVMAPVRFWYPAPEYLFSSTTLRRLRRGSLSTPSLARIGRANQGANRPIRALNANDLESHFPILIFAVLAHIPQRIAD